MCDQVRQVTLQRVGSGELIALGLGFRAGGGRVADFDYEDEQYQQRRQSEQQPAVAKALPHQQRQHREGCQGE